LLERQLDSEGLVDRECNVEKIEAVDTQIVDRVAVWVIFSRGMSQVSAMIVATVLNALVSPR